MSVVVSIRRARPTDAGAILECLRSAFEPYRASYTPDAYRDTVLTSETERIGWAKLEAQDATLAAFALSRLRAVRGLRVLGSVPPPCPRPGHHVYDGRD
jgi:hypothetical protein